MSGYMFVNLDYIAHLVYRSRSDEEKNCIDASASTKTYISINKGNRTYVNRKHSTASLPVTVPWAV